jgi:hypothetical protein
MRLQLLLLLWLPLPCLSHQLQWPQHQCCRGRQVDTVPIPRIGRRCGNRVQEPNTQVVPDVDPGVPADPGWLGAGLHHLGRGQDRIGGSARAYRLLLVWTVNIEQSGLFFLCSAEGLGAAESQGGSSDVAAGCVGPLARPTGAVVGEQAT